MKTAVLMLALLGCATNADVKPDAAYAFPPCADVGCGSATGLCKHDGECACPQPDGQVIECQRLPMADAGVDGKTYEDASAVTMPRIDAP